MPEILDSARKHGVSDEDMLHAFRHPVRTEPADDDDFTMIIGPGRDAALLEVGVVDTDEGPMIVHAMKARAAYLPGKRRHR